MRRALSAFDCIYYHDNTHVILVDRFYGQNPNSSRQICNYTLISNVKSCNKASRASLVIVDMALLRCSKSTSMGTIHIQIDSILALSLTSPENAKVQPNLDIFDE